MISTTYRGWCNVRRPLLSLIKTAKPCTLWVYLVIVRPISRRRIAWIPTRWPATVSFLPLEWSAGGARPLLQRNKACLWLQPWAKQKRLTHLISWSKGISSYLELATRKQFVNSLLTFHLHRIISLIRLYKVVHLAGVTARISGPQ